jgi:hypothetical protein
MAHEAISNPDHCKAGSELEQIAKPTPMWPEMKSQHSSNLALRQHDKGKLKTKGVSEARVSGRSKQSRRCLRLVRSCGTRIARKVHWEAGRLSEVQFAGDSADHAECQAQQSQS